MSTSEERVVSALRTSLLENKRLRRRNEELERAATEPVAIVGMACRYPGEVAAPEDLWRLVLDGVDAMTPFPADRGWDLADAAVGQGGFVSTAADFDAGFFGVSPREALSMDPQQRLVLETSWEALERGGIDPASVQGSRTGVFVGCSNQNYGAAGGGLPDGADGHLLTGNAASVVSGRVSYVLGCEGPAVTVDTACSSSLVALHLAVQSLRSGECDLALAGGVTVMATPEVFAEFDRQGGLAGDGRCKAFAEAADGTGWGEGAGILLVERLSDAERNGHRVLAVVRGSAVNQDGASNGLTAPNGPAQQRVIRAALENAGLRPQDVDAVEAHGTGTTLGDPIEAGALLSAYGREREAGRPLWLGSVKSNIGHTQAAAGAAGVIKMVEALRHGVLPATLHVDEATSHVDWSSGQVRLLTEQQDWPEAERPRTAGVSAFGVSGTNAHVLLQQYEPARTPEEPEAADRAVTARAVPPLVTWPLSGRTEEALRDQARALSSFVDRHPGLDPYRLGRALATTRTHFTHRAVVVAEPTADFAGILRGLADGTAEKTPELVRGQDRGEGRTAFLFAGQGAQRLGMGRELYEAFPVFAEAFDAVCALVGEGLRDVVFGEDADRLNETGWTQPALFAFEVALFRLVESLGVRPEFVAGHSVGEIAAAHVAGVFSLEDACALVSARGRLMQQLPSGGAMWAVEASEEEVLPLLEGRPQVGIAAINGPRTVVLSGAEAEVEALATQLKEQGHRISRLKVSHAFHSPLMDPMVEEFRAVAEGVTYGPSQLAAVSTLTGAVADADEWADPAYWVRHVREAVRFGEGVEALAAAGVTRFLEIGPDGTLTALAAHSLSGDGGHLLLSTQRKERPEAASLFRALAGVYSDGGELDWAALLGDQQDTSDLDLPTYPFQRRRYWLSPDEPASGTSAGPVHASAVVDASFWAAVEQEDLDNLAADLRITPGTLEPVLPALSAWYRQQRDRVRLNSLCYEVSWQVLTGDGEAVPTGTRSGRWAVLAPGGGAGGEAADVVESLVAALRARGLTAQVIETAADEHERLAPALRTVREEHGPLDGVLSLLALDPAADPAATTIALISAANEAGSCGRLWTLTRGAVAVSPAESPDSLAQSGAWGLGRVAALEHPDLWGGLIDLPASVDALAASRIVKAVTRPTPGEDQLAVRANGLFGRRLVAASPLPAAAERWEPRGTVLITGGSGALAGHLARWAVERGARDLLLVSRRGAEAPGASALREELTEAGAQVTFAALDVSVREDLAALLAEHPLDAVFHTAGVLDDGTLLSTGAERLARVRAPKAEAALLLDELTRAQDLSAFVLFSSLAGTLGSPGQSAYAAANATLDALAERRRAAGLPGTSIAWGPWAGGGMAAEAADRRRGRGAVTALDPETALSALGAVLDSGRTHQFAADIDWDRFVPAFTAVRPSALLAALAPTGSTEPATAQGTASDPTGLRGRLAGLSVEGQLREVLGVVRSRAAGVLGFAGAGEVGAERSFRDLGVDSLIAVELRNVLASVCGVSLPATVVFDYPTPLALAGFVRDEVCGGAVAEAAGAAVVPVAGAGADEPVAIVGMACRFPGGVDSPESLWELLVQGRDGITDFPTDRGWDSLDEMYDRYAGAEGEGRTYTRQGGFLSDVGGFDAEFFGVSPREALAMDPQQRLLLEASWEAVERSGMDPRSLRGSRTGVFAGTNGQDYPVLLGVSEGDFGGYVGTGSAASVVSGRVSYVLGLEGPAVTVDTACSSSLVALHLAVRSVRSGECDMALAGGATVMSTPGAFVEFSRQGGLAVDGRCKAFGEGADGTGWGEGVGVVVVERLSVARAKGHRVLAVVRGSAVNQDGASNGLTAPNGPSQQRVIRAALADAGVSASGVDAVEAHGTGTALGDPIEAQALLATYGQDRRVESPLLLGSVKSNLGHTQAAAGVAGVIKMVEALGRGVLPASLHVDVPSSRVDWSAGAVRVLEESSDWPEVEGRPRRAGVSSFGLSGTNAHVILEQAPEDESGEGELPPDEGSLGHTDTDTAFGTDAGVDGAGVPVAWVVSGRGRGALAAQAERLAAWVEERPGVDVRAVGRALALTRSAFEDRAVVRGFDREELLAGLGALARSEASPRVTVGVVGEGRTAFLFAGQGAQRLGMGRELYEAFPAFAEAFDATCTYIPGLKEIVFEGEDSEVLRRTEHAQPALFAFEVALFRLVESFGVRPDFVAGHSVGEIAAAHIAGVFSLEDACTLVAARGRLMQQLPAGGAMWAVEASEAEVLPLLDNRPEVGIAAVNGPRAVVLSGAEAEVEALAAQLKEAGHRTNRLKVSHAFHSPLMDPMLEEFRTLAESLTYETAQLPVVSTLTGTTAQADEWTNPAYWVRHVREAVRFADGIEALAEAGVTRFLEIGPDSTLTALATHTLAALSEASVGTGDVAVGGVAEEYVCASAARKEVAEAPALLEGLARLYVAGAAVDWAAVAKPVVVAGVPVDLPSYAFQRTRYWPETSVRARGAGGSEGDRAFWEIVGNEDAGQLAATLGVSEDALGSVLPALTTLRQQYAERLATDQWRYRTEWVPVSRAAGAARDGRWLLLQEPGTAPLAGLEEFLPGLERIDCAARERDGLAGILKDAVGGDQPQGVLSCLPAAAHEGVALALALVQALGDAAPTVPLWLATRAGFGPESAPEDPWAAAVWGLGRVAALEYPERWGGLLDLPRDPGAAELERAAAVLAAGEEDQVAVRAEGTYARRLLPAPVPAATADWTAPSRILVTGGTGALGAHVARWLLEHGTTELVLTSRSGPEAPGATALAEELRDGGAKRVEILACDIADREAVTALLDAHPVDGVVHAAGVLDVAPLDIVNPEDLNTALRAKAEGAVLLDELSRGRDWDAFVVFSSIAGVWGSGGQGAYAAANACAEGVVERRRAGGLAGTSVAWGPWAGGGMVSGEGAGELERRGLRLMDPGRALAGLERALGVGEGVVVVADVDWERFVPAFTSRRPSPLLAQLPQAEAVLVQQDRAAGAAGTTPPLVARILGLPRQERGSALREHVRQAAALALGHGDAAGVDPGRSFRDLGFDSLTAVELRNTLTRDTGLRLSATVVFDHPSAADLARHLDAVLAGESRTVATMLAELETSVSGILSAEPDRDARELLGSRLRAMLARVEGAETEQEADGAGSVSLSDRLDGASDEELFDFISRELDQ
ncbi:type I polyketide synthase [Streptomyces physcomitrii]|uniref:SDR family NAD(P)-dependent oxidoreductase n=1 Tax=Streptomyces physcomitrii TaxID=2724184 RepID=A0ABX1HCV9_9ACTN|nr:type I polyketide synthase [Streptomyces physcomitrii]NKI45064.1 SDR family NAD(P)-dependent oxidoreductase [Streptomyces physcomitrii]